VDGKVKTPFEISPIAARVRVVTE